MGTGTLAVAVIGAGPAGATVARLLAAQGARVALFEAQRLPRDKVCSGGLTPKAQRLLPPGILDAVERRIHRVDVIGPWGHVLSLNEPAAEVAMVKRARFDLALVEAASTAGAIAADRVRIDTVVETEFGVTLEERGHRFDVDVLIAADGSQSPTARALGLGRTPARRSLALEVDVPYAAGLRADTAVLSFTVPGGYAWCFPKADHLTLGAGSCRTGSTTRGDEAELRRALKRFAADLGIDITRSRVRGHWLPQGLRAGPMASRRVVLVGDAAATADPLFGEGISYAIASAMVAAQAIADMERGAAADLRPYDEQLRRLMGPVIRRLGLAAAAADRSTRLALAAIRMSPWVRTYAVDVIAGRRPPFSMDLQVDERFHEGETPMSPGHEPSRH